MKPICPECKEPAKVVTFNDAYVNYEVDDDGGVGKMLSIERTSSLVTLECANKHIWKLLYRNKR